VAKRLKRRRRGGRKTDKNPLVQQGIESESVGPGKRKTGFEGGTTKERVAQKTGGEHRLGASPKKNLWGRKGIDRDHKN